MEIFWFIPLHGDGRYLGTPRSSRPTNYRYLRQVAQALDHLGYAGALLPTGRSCEDSWVVASSLLGVTERMKFLIALRPGLISPTVAARMAATFDRMSEGRLLVNIVAGGDPVELAGEGLHLAHDARYDLTDEFLTVYRRLMAGEEVTFDGQYIQVHGGRVVFPPIQQYPPLFLGGSSPAAMEVAARHVDVSLTWGEPPAQVAEKIAEMRTVAARHGRTLRFGMRMHVIVRETTDRAWQAADELIKYVDDATIANAQRTFARYDSVGQQRMTRLHNGDRASLEISPNLWAGVGLVRGGAGTALVGDPATVAARMQEYNALGIDSFILSGYPHLEEAYRFAELVFPLITEQPSSATGEQLIGPFGEIIAPAAKNG